MRCVLLFTPRPSPPPQLKPKTHPPTPLSAPGTACSPRAASQSSGACTPPRTSGTARGRPRRGRGGTRWGGRTYFFEVVMCDVNVRRTESNWIGHVASMHPSIHPSTSDRPQNTHHSAMTLKRRWKGSKCAWLAVSTRHHFLGVHAYVLID